MNRGIWTEPLAKIWLPETQKGKTAPLESRRPHGLSTAILVLPKDHSSLSRLTTGPQQTLCSQNQRKEEICTKWIYRVSVTGMDTKSCITAFPERLSKWLPFFQEMAGFGAPDTSQVSTAVIPSVTVVSSGGCINAGLMSTIKNRKNSMHQLSETSFTYYHRWLYIHFYRTDRGEGHESNTRKPFSSDCNLSLFIS